MWKTLKKKLINFLYRFSHFLINFNKRKFFCSFMWLFVCINFITFYCKFYLKVIVVHFNLLLDFYGVTFWVTITLGDCTSCESDYWGSVI